jgi:dCMP deaminase
MNMWNRRFLDMAKLVGSWSKDPKTKVGAVIVDNMNRVISLGYNGFPRGVDDSPRRYLDRETKLTLVVHAELNAILNSPAPVAGYTLYTTLAPCAGCAKAIIQSGIKRVIAGSICEEWTTKEVESMFEEAGVEVLVL